MSERVKRTDLLPLRRGETTPEGFFVAEARIARVGIQIYHDAQGRERRELRLPEEVEKSAASFNGKPLTNDHPREHVTATNAKEHVVGAVTEPQFDGKWIKATLTLYAADAIEAAKAGRQKISCGYSCEQDETQDPKLVAKWGEYHSIQRNIRGNHVAIVDASRAGDDARLRLDASSSFIDDALETNNQEETYMDTATETKNDNSEIEQLRRERDELAGKLAALEQLHKDAAERVERRDVDGEIASRLKLVEKIWNCGFTLDVKQLRTDGAIKKAFLARAAPTIDIRNKSPDYISAAFDTTLQHARAQLTQMDGAMWRMNGREALEPVDVDAAERRYDERFTEMNHGYATQPARVVDDGPDVDIVEAARARYNARFDANAPAARQKKFSAEQRAEAIARLRGDLPPKKGGKK